MSQQNEPKQETAARAIAIIESQDFKKQLQSLLPVHIKMDQFVSVARRGIVGNKALDFSKMDRNTLFASVLKAAEQGLRLDGEEAALVQYGSSVQFMKMIKGVKKQLRNSGEIKEITAEVVYKNDSFDYWVDETGKHIKHKPNFMSDRGEPVCAYSIISTKDGGSYIKVMSKQEIELVKKASKTGSANFSPWNGPFAPEMWCKTVLRRNAKDCPTSTDLNAELFKDWDENFDFQNDTSQSQPEENQAAQKTDSESKPKKKTKLEKIIQAENSAIEKKQQAETPDVIDVSENNEQNYEENYGDTVPDDQIPI